MYRDKQFIFKASWKLAKLYDKSLGVMGAKWGLTQSEMDTLIYLHYNRRQNTSRDIAEYRSISKSLICKSVASLTEKGLIACSQDQADARVVRLTLTAEGAERAMELSACCERMCEAVFNGVPEEEIRLLERVIRRLQENGKMWIE